MMSGDQIAARIEVAMKNGGYNPRSLADAAKLNPTGVRDILIRKVRDPKYDTLERIATVLGLSVHQMLYGASNDIEHIASDHPTIPRLDVSLSAGHGAVNPDHAEVLDHIPFTEDFILRKLKRRNTNGLVCVDAHGESMEPTIGDGDLLIVDHKYQDLAAGIYAVNYEGESYVKRLEKVGGGYSLVSDNRAYVPISVQGEALDKFSIIGKVLWAGKVF